MADPVLLDAARTALGLDDLHADPETLALLPVVQAATGAPLAALAALDVASIPTEPDLDPSRAPSAPIT